MIGNFKLKNLTVVCCFDYNFIISISWVREWLKPTNMNLKLSHFEICSSISQSYDVKVSIAWNTLIDHNVFTLKVLLIWMNGFTLKVHIFCNVFTPDTILICHERVVFDGAELSVVNLVYGKINHWILELALRLTNSVDLKLRNALKIKCLQLEKVCANFVINSKEIIVGCPLPKERTVLEYLAYTYWVYRNHWKNWDFQEFIL